MYHLRRTTIFAVCLAVFVFLAWLLPRVLNPVPPTPEKRRRDEEWVNTSPYWLDRQACRWLSLCGLHHVRWDPPALPNTDPSRPGNDDDDGDLRRLELRSFWEGGEEERIQRRSWEAAGRTHARARGIRGVETASLEDVPAYVLAHAPLVHLYSGENFWPADIAEHIKHMTAYVNGSALNLTQPLGLRNLHRLNAQSGQVSIASNDNVEDRPEWLHNHRGIPTPFEDDGGREHLGSGGPGPLSEPTTWFEVDRDHPLHRISDPRAPKGRWHGSGLLPRALRSKMSQRRAVASQHPQHPMGDVDMAAPPVPQHRPDEGGYSEAPAVLVMVDKGSGILDAFWFFFYSYNLGQTVANIRFGNHVGDWEHCMVRFEHGIPRAMFLSEHEGGQAFAWSALEKRRPRQPGAPERPVIYSAVGSHAMYAFPGDHPYVLPFEMLKDSTDRGPLWDPAKNKYAYFFDYVVDGEEGAAEDEPASLTPAASNPGLPTSWFHYTAPWGDRLYGLGDERQWRLFGQYHYVTGPQGPKFKRLDRDVMCQTQRCRILYSLDAGRESSWYG